MRPEGLRQWRIAVTPWGIELALLRDVDTYHLCFAYITSDVGEIQSTFSAHNAVDRPKS